jgi:hypothetical protein
MANVEQQAKIAKQHSAEFPNKVVWLYQYGPNSFGITFARQSESEKGVLIGCYYKGKDVTPMRAEKIINR